MAERIALLNLIEKHGTGKSTLTVRVEPEGEIKYSLVTASGIPEALSNAGKMDGLPVYLPDYDSRERCYRAIVEAVESGYRKVVSGRHFDGPVTGKIVELKSAPGYKDELDADVQITLEEMIAAEIYQNQTVDGISNDAANEMGRRILRRVVRELRPDLLDGPKKAPLGPAELGIFSVSGDELNTILAAMRYYQKQGMGSPHNRPNWLQEIACPDGANGTSLDDAGIDELCVRLNIGGGR